MIGQPPINQGVTSRDFGKRLGRGTLAKDIKMAASFRVLSSLRNVPSLTSFGQNFHQKLFSVCLRTNGFHSWSSCLWMLGYPYLEGTDHNLPFTLLSTLACKVKCKLINILCTLWYYCCGRNRQVKAMLAKRNIT